jgi:hypothetical protein
VCLCYVILGNDELTIYFMVPQLPPPWVVKLFLAIVGERGTSFFSSLPIAPSKKSLLNDVFRNEEKRRLAKEPPTFYGDRKPRLASARELLVSSLVWWYMCIAARMDTHEIKMKMLCLL